MSLLAQKSATLQNAPSIARPFDLSAYRRIWTDYPFPALFKNLLITVVGFHIISMAFSCLAGYGVSPFQFAGMSRSFFLLITRCSPRACCSSFYNMMIR
jgi:ABC-type glycerol-3-phosphate transport system permease component